jgi:hypothetical protein
MLNRELIGITITSSSKALMVTFISTEFWECGVAFGFLF